MKLVQPWMEISTSVGGYNKSFYSACSSKCAFMDPITTAAIEAFAKSIDVGTMDAFIKLQRQMICKSGVVQTVPEVVSFCKDPPTTGLAAVIVGEIMANSLKLADAINAMNSSNAPTMSNLVTVDSLCTQFDNVFNTMPVSRIVINNSASILEPSGNGTPKTFL